MNKDALLASLIGLLIGLTITGIILLGPGVVKNSPQVKLPNLPKFNLSAIFPKKTTKQQQANVNTAKTETSAPADTFTIDSPLNEAIESSESVLVSGNAPQDAVIVIQGPTGDTVTTAGSDGKYAGKITVSEGTNVLTVTATVKDKQESKTITVFYTPEEI